MKNLMFIAGLLLVFATGCRPRSGSDKINLRLKWAYQAQFAGYLVAKEKGFYQESGLSVNIQPAGPDLRPYSTVANGADDIGIGTISQILSARSNKVPLVVIAQMFHDSPNRFVIKSPNRVDSLAQLKGKKIGLWLGGDEIEFISMLKSKNMNLSDFTVIPQKFSVAPFLADEYVMSQVMVYNELLQIKRASYDSGGLQIISPKDYNSAILGDLLFTSEKLIKERPDDLRKFLAASFKGWEYVNSHPDEAVDIVLKYNPELDREEQKQQLQEIIKLIYTGRALTEGMGSIPAGDYENAKRILLTGMKPGTNEYEMLSNTNTKDCFTSSIWEQAKAADKVKK